MAADRNPLQDAYEAFEAERWDEAAAAFEEVLARAGNHPASHIWWYDGALAYKMLRNWPKAFELGVQAAKRAPRGEQDPAFWNLGIAATIQGEWAVARDAWAGYGIVLPPGEGEIDENFGRALVRLDPDSADGEVVWVGRVCPARGLVLSVPVGGRRYGEIVVHDGEPKGERFIGERRYPVFEELKLWRASDTPSWRAVVRMRDEADMAALRDVFDEAGLAAEAAASVKRHRRQDSEGSVAAAESPEIVAGPQEVLLAAPDEATAERLLTAWVAAGPDHRSWNSVRLLSGGSFGFGAWTFVHDTVMTGQRPALYVHHDEDGDWLVADGVDDATADNVKICCVACLTDAEPSIEGLADLPAGWGAERETAAAAWTRFELEPVTE